MKRRNILLAALSMLSVSLTGCLSTSMRSMSTMPLPAAHQPRTDPTSKNAEVTVSVDGFGIFSDSWFNTQDIAGGGGIVSGTYRLGGGLSPLFVNGAIGSVVGSVNFDCEKANSCSETYRAWLATEDGKDDYSFWGLQELLSVGAEFNTPINLYLGLSAGVRLYQGAGGYDDQREDLDDEIPGIDNLDDGYGFSPTTSFWLGYHIGEKAKYGSVSLEISWAKEYYDDAAGELYLPMTLSYFHPSGFHGGVTYFGENGLNFNVGKTFPF